MENRCASRSANETEKKDSEYMEINVSTEQHRLTYQQLQIDQDQGSDDVLYDEIVCERAKAAKHEPEQTPEVSHQQPSQKSTFQQLKLN